MLSTPRRAHIVGSAVVIAATTAVSLGCTWITPKYPAAEIELSAPVFDQVEVTGLRMRDERLAGTGRAVTRGPGGRSVTGMTFYETFESDELLTALRYALEDNGVARRVVDGAPYRIEGRLAEAGTGGLLRTTNWLTALSLFGFAGWPFFGTAEAWVTLRLYHEDALMESYEGYAKARWRVHKPLRLGRAHVPGGAARVARRDALMDALAKLADGAGPRPRGASR